jgi:hypothetical protein
MCGYPAYDVIRLVRATCNYVAPFHARLLPIKWAMLKNNTFKGIFKLVFLSYFLKPTMVLRVRVKSG